VDNENGRRLSQSRAATKRKPRDQPSDRSDHLSFVKKNRACVVCKETHALSACKRFLELSSWHRRQHVRWAGACCRLKSNHRMESCRFNIQYCQCHGEHNSLLHLEATGGRNRAIQQVGSDETAVTSEEAVRKDGPDNIINIDGQHGWPATWEQFSWRRLGFS